MREDGVIGNIGRQDWMEPAEEGLQKLIHEAFEFSGGRHAKNFLHGTWLGEPLHVILTDVPIGAWTAAIVFDALDSMSPRRQYSKRGRLKGGSELSGYLPPQGVFRRSLS
jgi:hypothetical protein